MPVPYFYEPTLTIGVNQFTLSPETSKHCVQVLRMQEGANIDITNGMGAVFNATIQTAHKANSVVTIQQHQSVAASQQKITLGISLLKNAVRLEWLFEKATEMGIHQIVPIILQSAMIQSQQAWLPLLSEPIEFDAFIHKHKASVNLIAHCEPSEKKNIKEIIARDDVNLLIGPEGDFSSSEIATAISNNYTPIQLGPTRLRTETAGIFALSVLKIF
jgi:16S rRNA (uracil1498-N3)-methyltransferase